MLSTLHQLLVSGNDEIVIAYDGQQSKTLADLKREVILTQSACQTQNLSRYVIACRDPWFHLVAMLALQQLGKTVVFPHNQAPTTLDRYRNGAALVADDSQLQPDVFIQEPVSSIEIVSKSAFRAVNALDCTLELYTSGSTAEPKKIVKSLAVFEREAVVLQSQFTAMNNITHIIGSVTHYHIYGFLFRVVWPLLSGRRFDRRLITNIEQLKAAQGEHRALIASPVMLEHLAQDQSELSIGVVFSSGGPLKFSTSQSVKAQTQQYAFEVFGSSETGGIAWRRQTSIDTPWQLFSGLSYRAVADQLVIQSPFVDQAGDYYTDDSIRCIDDRHFQLIGRRDRVVKLAEKRVSLSAIERSVTSLKEVECAVAIVSETGTRKVVNLAIVLTTLGVNNGHSVADWWKFIRRHLAKETESVALPRKIQILGSIPRNSQGKTDNQKLQELFY
ncbi:AMP-binding protein [Vibrio agarivorans]|uniref:AMP-binding protein n=1 Tax=Vibrio agarivorans TaxID=153622 RepID=UPI0022304937|nr:AMP-binding protein [Vibrio agarivorans]